MGRNKIEKKYEMHVIAHTHWDREWKYPFQQYRMALVDCLDHLLEIMDNDSDYKYFHLDGQTILLEDYLEIRPENKNKLKKYIKQGRILVGPWYTIPDENLINGECIVRNLMMGHKVAGKFGKIMKEGYTPGSYGQVSQMPQIFKGFGIDTIMFRRGVQPYQVPFEFIWEGADETKILAFVHPRSSVYTHIRRQVLSDEKLFQFRLSDQHSYPYHAEYCRVGIPKNFHKDKIPSSLLAMKEKMKEGATVPYLFCGDGTDNIEPNPFLPKIIKEANKVLSHDKIFISSLPIFMRKVKKSVKGLKVLKGEMRFPARDKGGYELMPGVLSARMYLKQINRKIEVALIKWAEVFATFAYLLGEKYPEGFLEKAWKYLLANHPHDDLPGCSVDKVHEDMLYRFSQAEGIANGIIKRSLGQISKEIDNSDLKDDEIPLVVFNSLPYSRTEVITVEIDFPKERKVENFFIYDACGKELPYQLISRENTIIPVNRAYAEPDRFSLTRFKVQLLANVIPPLGYKVLRIKPEKAIKNSSISNIITDKSTMENEFLKVKINNNGTLQITDKRTKKIFDNCNMFEDSGDAGDDYTYKPPRFNKIITTKDSSAFIQLIENGPLSATFEVQLKMSLPKSLDHNRERRINKNSTCLITSYITLRKGSRRIDILTEVDNNVKEHRLRALFPAEIDAEVSQAEGQFDVVKRQIKLPNTTNWKEPLIGTHPQYSFVDVNDEEVGLAVINKGLPEYEVMDNKERTIALTLIRAFRGTIRVTRSDDPYQISTQCLGKQSFEYAIYPHARSWESAEVFKEAYTYNVPLRAVLCKRQKGHLLKETSFFQIEPFNLVLSSIKKCQERNSIIIRIFNPTEANVKGKISCYKKIIKAGLVNLNEEPIKDIKISGNHSLFINVKKKQIITVELFVNMKAK